MKSESFLSLHNSNATDKFKAQKGSKESLK